MPVFTDDCYACKHECKKPGHYSVSGFHSCFEVKPDFVGESSIIKWTLFWGLVDMFV